MDDKFLTITGACEYAGVCRRTIYNWIALKRLTVYLTPSGKTRIKQSDLVWRKKDTGSEITNA